MAQSSISASTGSRLTRRRETGRIAEASNGSLAGAGSAQGGEAGLFKALFFGLLELFLGFGNAGQLGLFSGHLGAGVGRVSQNRDVHQQEQFGTVMVAR